MTVMGILLINLRNREAQSNKQFEKKTVHGGMSKISYFKQLVKKKLSKHHCTEKVAGENFGGSQDGLLGPGKCDSRNNTSRCVFAGEGGIAGSTRGAWAVKSD